MMFVFALDGKAALPKPAPVPKRPQPPVAPDTEPR
jgi:hypothetical protein